MDQNSGANSRNARWRSAVETARADLLLVAVGLPVELLWEVAQFPLYAQWYNEPATRIAAFALHCTHSWVPERDVVAAGGMCHA